MLHTTLIEYVLFCIAVMLIGYCSASGDQAPPTRADAIVVLAGSYQERIPAAAKLFQGGHAPVIILTNDGVRGGWSRKYQRTLYQIERAEELLVKSGVPRKWIIQLPFYGSGTVYDALAAERYAQVHGLGKLLLVTSDYHARRAMWTFRHVLRDRPLVISVFSVSSGGSVVKETAMESVKLLYYRIWFGVMGLVPELRES
jgi:uncharacterized SAM-binding protein YcdF (DUF218 family)